MENQMKLDIGKILIIACKTDDKKLDFVCRNREYDGFVYFDKGHGKITYDDGAVFAVENFTFVLLRKGTTYRFEVDGGHSYITSAFEWTSDSDEALSSVPRVLNRAESYSPALDAVCRRWQMQLRDAYMRCKIGIIGVYLDVIENPTQRNADDRHVERALEFIHANFKRNFTSEELASHCKVSPSYIRAKFKSSLGMSVTAYRDTLRINAAEQMLSSGIFSVKETAYELGYCDVYHFSKAFSALVGISPAKFAQNSYKSLAASAK